MTDLGPVVSTHPGRLAAGGLLWPIGAVLVLSGPVTLVRDVVMGTGFVTGLLTLAIATPLGAALLLYSYALYAQRIVAHQHGLVWTRLLRAPLVLRWDQVREVRMRSTVGGRGTYHLKGQDIELELVLNDGRELWISNDLERAEELRGYMSAPRPTPGAPTPPSPWG